MSALARNDNRTGRLNNARRAYDATLAAYETRLAFEAGQRTAREADAAERKRQDAVGGMTGGAMMLFNMFGGRTKKDDLPKPEFEGLVLENVDLFTFIENGRPVMAVSGIVRNTTTERAELPPLTLAAIDQWQFILAGQTSLLPVEALEPGEAKTLRTALPQSAGYDLRGLCPLRPALRIPHAPRMRPRRHHESETPVHLAPRRPSEAAAITSRTHTAAELNLLTRIYRTEAAVGLEPARLRHIERGSSSQGSGKG